MKIIWLGHSSFRIEIGDQVLLVDPWLGNPLFPKDRRAEAIDGATAILVSHAHGDHAAETPGLARDLGIPVVCVHELGDIWGAEGLTTMGMGRGGTHGLGEVAVTMVAASHSSSLDFSAPLRYAGGEAGFMIKGEGQTIYFSGDTDIMADMGWMGEYHKPNIGLLCCGGLYTMDMAAAAWAAKRYFDFATVIPCHYRTFGALAQDAAPLVAALPGVDVRVPEVMEAVEL